VAASALLGVIVTVAMNSDPGNALGVLVVAGTVVACLAVRPRSVRLIIPAPTMSYVPAAVIAGAIHDRATDTSHTMEALNAGSWIASGFFMMALATIVAIVFTGLRLYLDWHYRPATSRGRSYPRPGPVPVGDDWDATRRLGPDPADAGQTAPVGQASRDQTRPIGSDTSTTGPYAAPQGSTGPYRSQDTAPSRSQDTGPYRPQDTGTGPYRPQDTGSYRPGSGPTPAQETGAHRSESGGPVRRQIASPSRPQIAGPSRPQGSGPYEAQDSGPYGSQGTGSYQAQEPYGSGPYPYPDPAD
jgi:hypothetical protein